MARTTYRGTGAPNGGRAAAAYVLQVGVFVLSFAVALFVSSGRLDWLMGWVFIAIVAATHIRLALVLMITNPALMGERAHTRGKRDLDRILASIWSRRGRTTTNPRRKQASSIARIPWTSPTPDANSRGPSSSTTSRSQSTAADRSELHHQAASPTYGCFPSPPKPGWSNASIVGRPQRRFDMACAPPHRSVSFWAAS
jgi:hypothetical protein